MALLTFFSIKAEIIEAKRKPNREQTRTDTICRILGSSYKEFQQDERLK